MALAEVDLKTRYTRGKKPSRQVEVEHNAQRLEQSENASPKSRWVEGGPSYLDGIRATLATLTEEDKDAIHLSLQG